MGTADKFRYKLQTATVVEKLIAINVICFILFFLARTIAFLFQWPADFLLEWFVFPKEPGEYIFKPWSIITYSFLHSGIWHILSNMLILYYAGIYFLQYFSPRKLLNFYFMGVIIGALVYMLSYNLFPAFAATGRSYLVGASAGVMAVLVGIATHVPNLRIRLLFLGSIKFWYIAAFLVLLDIIQIPISNSGGHLAHLGGALFGYVYASQLKKGNDIAGGFEKVIAGFLSYFESGRKTKSRMRTVYRKPSKASSTSTTTTSTKISKTEKQEKIDAILDKISKSGYDSLTKQEKDFLFQAGKDN
ncbi:rhomboid family intramembrane serine protease [Antarcticibacterium flavum]|uniref:Rhomboid family intramembrane serine protease n=1 Tax=Antarcticibacterium flavum TaxID=2058175 RepID=A0A5B7X769_9FLAO|nr:MULTISPECIES: rhomboid family intramembrane serine protease [Antarcticibacterium]MCM4159317.1 rhomboid family intramembrane serine protease [Antarcticibacterium sp. W02-3]QCY70975.1 rhomboid family intramembrane serine protease [Antarcticibacterium flavum]